MYNIAISTIIVIMIEGMILAPTLSAGSKAISTVKKFNTSIYSNMENCSNPFNGCSISIPKIGGASFR